MICLYHSNCSDGSGSALAVWLKFGDHDHEYIPVQYGNDIPEKLEGQDLIIVDFSFNRQQLIELAKKVNHIQLIDHHITAKDDLEGIEKEIENIDVIFDMSKSGALLTWEHFHPDKEVPYLIEHISDRDLWKFKLDGTKDVIAGLQLHDDWKTWEKYINNPLLICEIEEDGYAINQYLDVQQEKIVKATKPIVWDITGDTVPIYNLLGFMISDTLNKALEIYTEADYAVSYFELPAENKRVYSLRSRVDGDIDVSEIARANGGGGHIHSAAFVVKLK